jgi:protein required for attachment to host cells
MSKPLRTEFIIADGGRARWVRRSETADDFTTEREILAAAPDHAPPQGVVFESSSGQRFGVGGRKSAAHIHAEKFAEEVAEVLNAEAAAGKLDRLALVAPSRTLNAIRGHLTGPARAALARTLAKDLTKTPDHELGEWLRRLERG